MSGSLTGLISHTRRVQTLYKQALRNLENFYDRRPSFRYHQALLRARFDQNKNLNDMILACQLVEEGEKELKKNLHWSPKQFADSPGGVAYGREVISPDWLVDYWDPLEKAQYPEYFARREQRKREYVKLWEEKYGKAPRIAHH